MSSSKCSSCHIPCDNNPNYKGYLLKCDDCLYRHSHLNSSKNRQQKQQKKRKKQQQKQKQQQQKQKQQQQKQKQQKSSNKSKNNKNSSNSSSSNPKTLYTKFSGCVDDFEKIKKTAMGQHSKSSDLYAELLVSKDTCREAVKEHKKARYLREKLVNSAIHKIFSRLNSDEDACDAGFKAEDAILLESKARQEMIEAGKELDKANELFDEAYELDNQLLETYHRIGDTMYDAFKAFIECVVANISTKLRISRKQLTSDHFINVLNEHSIEIEGLSVETHILKGGQKGLYVSCEHCFFMVTL